MKKLKVAINGFGRIGRSFFKLVLSNYGDNIEIVGINDLGDVENLAYLLKYDTAYGKSKSDIKISREGEKSFLICDNKKISFFSERNPEILPWKGLDVDVVVESTGVFREYGQAKMHLTAGARRVVISAPAKGEPLADIESATVLMGVNEDRLKTCLITSNASCTTNASSPVVKILEEALDIEKAMIDTIHGYTATQSLQDAPNKDYRKGRAAAVNLIPSSTGAAESVTKAVEGIPFFDGISVRVPVIVGSLVDVTFISKKKGNTKESVNDVLRQAAKEKRWEGIFTVTEEPVVSSDIVGNIHASIADLSFTRVVGGDLVKVMVWYDNEVGYTNTLVRHVIEIGEHI
jgi:glyceraldehyde 3-phosphate dehydrogenase